MNSIESLTIREETVSTPGGDFTVGALSAGAIIGLVARHRQILGEIFVRYRAQQALKAQPGSTDTPSVETVDVMMALLNEAPDVVAEIIVRGAGDFSEGAMAVAQRLDFGTQFKALEAITKLTTEGHGGLGNLVAVVLRVIGAATASLKEMQGKTV